MIKPLFMHIGGRGGRSRGRSGSRGRSNAGRGGCRGLWSWLWVRWPAEPA